MRLKRILLIVLMISIAAVAAACSQESTVEESGLIVNNWTIALGAVDENMDKTRISFDIGITNRNEKDVYIKSVEIVTGDKIRDIMISGDTNISFNKILKADEAAQLKGEIIIDTKGLSKGKFLI